MKVITYLQTINLGEDDRFYFNYDRASVRFQGPDNDITLYFHVPQGAMNFISEIMEAIHNGAEMIDLSHMIAIPNYGFMGAILCEIKQRITDYQHEEEDENEDDK
ncbi:MAG: hypothetical protein IJ307_06900 [Bacteroidales bacterium]|nr:hypothetical protein [Bacteroidales bacterium]